MWLPGITGNFSGKAASKIKDQPELAAIDSLDDGADECDSSEVENDAEPSTSMNEERRYHSPPLAGRERFGIAAQGREYFGKDKLQSSDQPGDGEQRQSGCGNAPSHSCLRRKQSAA